MKTKDFLIHYKKDNISSGLLWENHCHANFELIAVLSGDIGIIVEGNEFLFSAGDSILIPPLCYHSVSANKTCVYRRLTASFEEAAIPSALRSALFKKSPLPFSIPREQTERLCMICKSDDASFYAPLAEALMIQILYDCAACTHAERTTATDPILRDALEYIDEHLCEKLTLDKISAYTACSKSLLCHRFQARMHISPKQYILQKRMALAVKLIGDGMLPTQVAAYVGYDNYSNFYRMYKKHIQSSPSE